MFIVVYSKAHHQSIIVSQCNNSWSFISVVNSLRKESLMRGRFQQNLWWRGFLNFVKMTGFLFSMLVKMIGFLDTMQVRRSACGCLSTCPQQPPESQINYHFIGDIDLHMLTNIIIYIYIFMQMNWSLASLWEWLSTGCQRAAPCTAMYNWQCTYCTGCLVCLLTSWIAMYITSPCTAMYNWQCT